MDQDPIQQENSEQPLEESRFTRSQLLKAAGVGIAAAAVPAAAKAAEAGPISFPFYPQVKGTYSTEMLSDISRVLHTSEHLAAGVMFTALQSTTLNLAGNPLLLSVVQAALVQHQRHAEFLDSIGNPLGLKGANWFVSTNAAPAGINPPANPVKLTMPNDMLSGLGAFFTGVELLETLSVGMYIAAIREFSELGQPEVAKWMGQILGVEGGIRVLARGALAIAGSTSDIPPNNKAFETDYILYVRDAVPVLIAKGFFNGSGVPLPIFSPVTSRQSLFLGAAGPAATAVIQQKPNNATSTDVSVLPGERT